MKKLFTLLFILFSFFVQADYWTQKVYETKLQATTLNFKLQTSNYPKGIYFVEVTNGKQKAVKKFIKE